MGIKLHKLLAAALITASLNCFAQLNTVHDDIFWDNREAGMASYDVPEAGDPNYSNIYYINPEATTNGIGTIDSPLNAFPTTFEANTAYLLKRGSKSLQKLDYQYADYVLIGAYDTGERPIMQTTRLFGEAAVVRDIAVDNAGIGFGKWPYNDVENCWLYNCEVKGVGVFTSETKVIGNIIHGAATDAIWMSGGEFGHYTRNNEIAYNHVYDVNMNWYPGATQKVAAGDGIQAIVSESIHIHHNLIDRSSTGNKFNIIIGEPACPEIKAIIEDNVFYAPIRTSQGGAILYLKKVVTPAIIRNNKFIDTKGNGLLGIFSERYDIQFYGNFMMGLSKDIVPKTSTYYNNTMVDLGVTNAKLSTKSPANNIFFNSPNIGGTNLFVDETDASTVFTDWKKGYYTLTEGSKAINTGISVNPDWKKDMRGFNVASDGKYDMGAFVYSLNDTVVPNPDTVPEDKDSGTNTDTTQVTNTPPVINIRSENQIYKGMVLKLDASNSYDAEDNSLSFNWSIPSEFAASSLSNNSIEIQPTELATTKSYSITLNVSDGKKTTQKTINIGVEDYCSSTDKLEITSVEASDYQDSNVPENIIDNNIYTRWSADGDGQWIMFELKDYSYISHIEAYFYKGETRKAFFDLFTSIDGENWEQAIADAKSSGFSSTLHTFSVSEDKKLNAYKYVKLVGHMNEENTWNSFNELSIWGETSSTTAINSVDNPLQEATVYPNPANEDVFVKLNEAATINVLSSTGKRIYYQEGFTGENKLNFIFKSGVYFVQVLNDNKVFSSGKLIVK